MTLHELVSLKKKLIHWFIGPPTDIVGLDIGTESIKIAEVSQAAGHAVLKAAGMFDLPPGLIDDSGCVVNPAELAAAIRRMLASCEISSRDVVVAVSGSTVFVRVVLFPVMSTAELKEAIKWDMEKYIPFESDSYYHDFAIIGPGKTKAEIRVLLVAAPRRLVDILVHVLKAANCQPLAIDIEAVALSRTLPEGENAVVIDIGGNSSQIVIFQESIPVVTRSLSFGGRRFTEVIMQVLNLDYTEAERVKQNLAGLLQDNKLTGEKTVVQQQLEEVAGEIVREVRRTLEYYQMQNCEMVIEHIHLTGGGARMDNLAEQLTAQFGNIKLSAHNSLEKVRLGSFVDEQYLRRLAPQLTVALGLAMYRGNYANR